MASFGSPTVIQTSLGVEVAAFGSVPCGNGIRTGDAEFP
jgi:hypothetical protein